jgi:nitroreductase
MVTIGNQISSNICEVIIKRKSWRSYLPVPLASDIKQHFVEMLSEDGNSPFGGTARFELIETLDLNSQEKRRLGTYGFIKGATNFLVGIMEKSQYDLEDLGFRMEKLILYATELGLSTCWLGGTFRRKNFAKQMNIKENEQIPAVSPIGYAAKNSIIGRFAKWGARSKSRYPWQTLYFEQDGWTPLLKKNAGNFALPLEMVRVAPSASNKQPWRIVKETNENNFHFFVFRTKRKGIRPRIRMFDFPRLDMGIATCHFHLVNQELGFKGEWKFNQPKMSNPDEFHYVISWFSK